MTLPFLTISIPTYNRVSIRETIQALLPQLTPEVRIQIIDNASPEPVINLLQGISSSAITVIRNSVNIGVSGNFIKCFEHCETTWMWFLSDDDLPSGDAISTILNTIRTQSSHSFIKYNSNLVTGQNVIKEDFIVTGLEDLFNNINNFGNFLFMSSTVCNAHNLRQEMKAAYYFSSTFCPHLAFLFAYLNKNPDATVLFSPLSIVKYELPDANQKWGDALLNKSLSDLVFFAPNPSSRKKLFDSINLRQPLNGPFAKVSQFSAMKAIIRAEAGEEQRHLLSDHMATSTFRYWAMSADTAKFLLKLVPICSVFLVLQIPGLSNLLKKIVGSSAAPGDANVVPMYNRYSYFSGDQRL